MAPAIDQFRLKILPNETENPLCQKKNISCLTALDVLVLIISKNIVIL